MTFPIAVASVAELSGDRQMNLYVDTRRHAKEKISDVYANVTDEYFKETILPLMGYHQKLQWRHEGFVAITTDSIGAS